MDQSDHLSTKQQPGNPPVPIVAIGASAGGLEAISDLLQHLSPTTGLAFVYIQHLSPTQPSLLSDILSRKTIMPVREAQDQMRIEANHVYIIPPNKDMEVVDGVLTLTPRRPKPALHLPIDQFFVSLAERQRAASIALVLSGTANDGTVGLKAIKAAGGITFAQDETAKFQGMPKAAQAEGVVDKVLSPKEMAQELEWLSHQQGLFQQTALAVVVQEQEEAQEYTENNTNNEDLGPLLLLLRKVVGVDFRHYKTATIRRRVLRRMALYKLPTLLEYTDYLSQHPAEASLLYNDLLINVTSFFRDTDTMEYLGKVTIPQLLNAKPDTRPFRLWVAACSTGEEVYSLAMMLLEGVDDQDTYIPIQIFATDLSARIIAQARLGIYTDSQMAGVSQKRRKRFFIKEEDGYRISKVIRDLCVFAPHNVFVDPPFSRIDLISCRNLLIYTDNVLQRKAIATFHYALNPTGHLMLGKAETVGSSIALFTQVAKNHKIYARNTSGNFSIAPMMAHLGMIDNEPSASLPSQDIAADQQIPGNPTSSSHKTPYNWAKSTERRIIHNTTMHTSAHSDDLDQRIDELLSQYTPASVVVNKDLEILRFRGSTSLFLEPAPGKVSFNLLKMARPELIFDLRNAVSKAHKSGQSVAKTGLRIRVRDQTYTIAINAIPLQTPNQESLVLVLFEEVTSTAPQLPPTAPTQIRNGRIKQLEDELATLRDDMRSMIEEQEAGREELQSANEEIISSNEELQSINEELETSKEEIQSNNEELQTINQELQMSNDQLSEAYDYSDAIFGTIRETVLVLDKDLRVRSANRAFYKTFRVEPDDTAGRLLYELGNRQWDIPALRTLLDQVIDQNASIQGYEMSHYFPELGEKVLRLNARKIVRHQGQAAILLAIEDITDHKQVQRLLEFLQSIITNAPVAIQLFRAVRNERGAIVDFQFVPLTDEMVQREKKSVDELYKNSYKALYNDTEQSDLFAKYAQVVETGEPLQVEITYQRAAWHLVSANRFDDGFLLVTSDITDRKKAEEDVRQRETQLRRLVENTPDVITRWDKDRKLVFANSAFEGKTASANSDLLGLTNLEMGQPKSIAVPYMASLQEVLDSGQPKDHYNFYPLTDRVVFFHSRMVPEFGADGSVDGVLAIARDITQLNEAKNLKQAYETIQQAALDRNQLTERLQVILDSSQTAILTLAPLYSTSQNGGTAQVVNFYFQTVNQALATYVGQVMTTLPGTLISQWFSTNEQDDTLLEHCRQTYLTGQTQRIEWHHTSDERDKWLDISLARVGDELLVTFSDFTELKQLQQQLENR